jgi:hypothetical protein
VVTIMCDTGMKYLNAMGAQAQGAQPASINASPQVPAR